MFNFKKKSEKDKDGKEKKEEKRKREKDRKARAERTLSGREMAGIIAGSRAIDGTQGITKREKHGLFHSLRKHDRRSYDLSDTAHQKYPNGEGKSEEFNTTAEQSVLNRVSAFEKLSAPQEQVTKPQKPSGNLRNGSDFKDSGRSGDDGSSLKPQEGHEKVKTRALELQRPSSPAAYGSVNGRPSYDRQSSDDTKSKQEKMTAVSRVQHIEIKPTKVSSVMSESTDGVDEEMRNNRQPPKASSSNKSTSSSSGKSYSSSLVVAPARKSSSKPSQPEIVSPTERSLDVKGVSLALPAVNPAVEGLPRICNLPRQPNGGFGFALRRSYTSDNQEIYLAEPLGEATSTNLLPGDKLLEVNGFNVENLSREKIVELVASSDSEVRLKVVPVPELAELTVRSGLDGGRVQVDETYLKSGSLARSGSMRMKKKVRVQLLLWDHFMNGFNGNVSAKFVLMSNFCCGESPLNVDRVGLILKTVSKRRYIILIETRTKGICYRGRPSVCFGDLEPSYSLRDVELVSLYVRHSFYLKSSGGLISETYRYSKYSA